MPLDTAPQGGDFDPRNIRYPVSFELRLILRAENAAVLREAIPEALDRTGTAHGALDIRSGERKIYVKARLSATFMDQDSMRAAYAALAALPGVKAVI